MTSLLENCFFKPSLNSARPVSMLQNALLSVKVQNLKSQNILKNYFSTSLLENCFLAVTQHCSSSINPTKSPIYQ